MLKLDIEKAIGRRIAHDLTGILPDGSKGVRFARGYLIRESDLDALRDIGKYHVFVENDADHEIHEEDAALRLAAALKLDGFSAGPVREGKISYRADADGIVQINETLLSRLNHVPDWTFASVFNNIPVLKGRECLSFRIIPLMTAAENVEMAEKIAAESPLMRLLTYRPLKVAILITGREIYEGRIKDAFEPILRRKLAAFPCEICAVHICPDERSYIESRLRDSLADGADLILLTGGMSVDPDDLSPGAIRHMADRFVFQGVPMQPGNMLTLAYCGSTALVGVPAASMHAPVTSLDLLLPLLFAGIDVDYEMTRQWGLGGLLRGSGPAIFASPERPNAL